MSSDASLPPPPGSGKVAAGPFPESIVPYMFRIHFGCGHVRLDGWINVDVEATVRPDLVADLGAGLPFRDGVADLIHSEDFVDQLELNDAFGFFHECHRLLKPGGVMRLLTPDLDKLLRFYCGNDETLIRLWNESVGLPLRVETLGEVVNRAMHLGGHTFLYDHETLVRVMDECGFRAVRVNYNQSEVPGLRGLDIRKPDETVSMYYDCYKKQESSSK